MSQANNKTKTVESAPMKGSLRTLFRALQRPYFQNNSHLRKAVEDLRGSKRNNTSTGKRVALPTKETKSDKSYVAFNSSIMVHWVADFILQTDAMARNKSSSNRFLLSHVLVYSITLMCFGPLYALVNGVVHFCIDYVTSRITKKLWAEQRVHDFFIIIGLDQVLHAITLILTMPLIWKFQ